MKTQCDEFIRGFAEATRMTINQAKEQWAGFSRNLTDDMREITEGDGYAAGVEMGHSFNMTYPLKDKE